ncbi:MAG: phage holin family protein [Bacteroidota bacterium]
MITETICASSIKSLSLKLALLAIAYFTPIAEMVIVMLIFLLFDTITGIWASLKKGEKLESHKLRKTVYKIICYTLAVMLSWMMEKTFSLTWSNLANLVCGFICFVELKSIFENITRITNEPVFMKILKIIKRKGAETIREIGEEDESQKDSQP